MNDRSRWSPQEWFEYFESKYPIKLVIPFPGPDPVAIERQMGHAHFARLPNKANGVVYWFFESKETARKFKRLLNEEHAQ